MKTFDFTKFAVLLCAGLLCICAHSQTFQVTTTADSGPGSLRDAITNATAAGGGTITFTDLPGPISILSSLPDINGSVTIRGNGPANTAISGNRTNRIFNVLGGATCSISDLTLQAGIPAISPPSPVYNGAKAIYNAGALSVSNCFIRDQGAGDADGLLLGGGGVTSVGSSLVLNNVIVSNNLAYGTAGFSGSNVRATNCLFVGNRTGDSSPIGASGDSVFSDCTFAWNYAEFGDAEGGGINAGGNLTLLNCSVTNNFGDWSTGGIKFIGTNLTISNCIINNNSAGHSYGGIYAVAINILILNSSISGNSAGDRNGGMTLSGNACVIGCTISSNRSWAFVALTSPSAGISASGTLNMTNCTVSGNWASRYPGVGVYGENNNSVIQAVNCTIAYNACGVSGSGSNTFYALNTIIANNGTGPTNGDFSGTLTSQGHNLIGNLNTNTVIVGSTNGDIYWVDPLLGPLQNNGGPTLTHALLTGSPAIEAGTRAGAPLTDQRGVVRQFGTAVDIGAWESQYYWLTNVVRITGITREDVANMHLRVEGSPGSTCTIQASSNLLNWENVFTCGSNAMGAWDFIDHDAANYPKRFYRALINNE